MAEGKGTNSNNANAGWNWNSWINAAKNKSSEVLEFVKKDLEEIGSVVKTEASHMVTSTSQVLEKTLKLNDSESTASSMKRTFSSFLGQMNTVLNPTPDDSDTEAVVITDDCETTPLTKLQEAILELQKHSGTFLKEPEQSLAAQYECWLEIISEQLTEERLAKHLSSSQVLHQQYLALVPGSVSHADFWKRYLFKKALVEDNLAHEEALEKRQRREEEQQRQLEDLPWQQHDLVTNIDISEEEQIKLLEQYEHEFKSKQKVKSAKKKVKSSGKAAVDEDVDQKSLDASPVKTPSSDASLESKSSSSSLDGEWECVTPDKI